MKQIIFYLSYILILFSCNKQKESAVFEAALKDNWKIISSKAISASGQEISLSGFSDKKWYPATIPTTVFNTLVENKVYTNVYMGVNIEKVNKSVFTNSWWYRTEFDLNHLKQTVLLVFEGINYRANIWLNGEKIADKNEIVNPFRQYTLNISNYVKYGKNILAVEVFPPQKGDFTIGFVDWNPAPPDNNMGIFRNVILKTIDAVAVNNPHIEFDFENDNFENVNLIFTTELKNYSDNTIKGTLQLNINNDISISKEININAGENKKVVLTHKDFEQLQIKNPKLWWPHTMGEANLYHTKVNFAVNSKVSDKAEFDFGIRKIEDFFTDEGHRGFKINGQKISIRGGGWVDNLTLNNTPENIKAQLEYVKDMNLNTIRLEGFWGTDHTIYELCDKMGILIMVGWSCHWEWEEYLGKYCDETYGGILSNEDIDLMSAAWQEQVLWLRNHPSIFIWAAGSDCIPKPELEQKYFDIFNRYDTSRIYLASAKEWQSLAGPSAVKMRGPYAYVPPVYWYSDTLYGGAFGFNTETCPGAQVPPFESIKKMIPEQHLEHIDSVWDFHCGRNEFNTLIRFTKALSMRYGKAKNTEDYAFKAQILNYELMRPMFEAFSAYRYKATGVIQWMLNSAWPEMYWQLYDYYLMPNGAYYGAKKAGQPVHAIYNYHTNSIWIANDLLKNEDELRLQIIVYDENSKQLFKKIMQTNINANSAREVFKLPEIKKLTTTYFLSLKLYDIADNEIDNNFYWLSTQKDILDYDAKLPSWYFYTPSKQYASFAGLSKLPNVKLKTSLNKRDTKEYVYFDLTIENPSEFIVFFINMSIVDKITGNTILPVLWTDNYVSLLPNEKQSYTAKINKIYLKDKQPELAIKAWNVK